MSVVESRLKIILDDKEKFTMGSNHSGISKGFTLPQDFFTAATFGTCGGCAMVTWVVTGVLSGLFHIDTGIVGLIVAMIVAYAGLFLTSSRQKSQYIITFFNGFLIYATVVGATSFLPYVNQKTANVVQQAKPSLRNSLTRPWIYDRNLISATRDLIGIQKEQSSTINKLDKTITTIEDTLTREGTLSAESRTKMLSQLSEGKKDIQSTREEIKPSTMSLERFGLGKN
jgi:hypothetical protein